MFAGNMGAVLYRIKGHCLPISKGNACVLNLMLVQAEMLPGMGMLAQKVDHKQIDHKQMKLRTQCGELIPIRVVTKLMGNQQIGRSTIYNHTKRKKLSMNKNIPLHFIKEVTHQTGRRSKQLKKNLRISSKGKGTCYSLSQLLKSQASQVKTPMAWEHLVS